MGGHRGVTTRNEGQDKNNSVALNYNPDISVLLGFNVLYRQGKTMKGIWKDLFSESLLNQKKESTKNKR